jgi:hypothetical protein
MLQKFGKRRSCSLSGFHPGVDIRAGGPGVPAPAVPSAQAPLDSGSAFSSPRSRPYVH